MNKNTAQDVAISAYIEFANRMQESDLKVKEVISIKNEDKNAFYVFNFEPTGFVIVSASDAVTPILGLSDESNFSLNDMPLQLEDLFSSYKSQIKEVEKQNKTVPNEIKNKWDKYLGLKSANIASASLSSVSPLVQTTWDQDNDYAMFCPDSAGFRFPVGCGGTAMAQILYYWNCRVNESGTVQANYTDYLGWSIFYSLDSSDYQWESMSLSSADVYNAKLLYDCAVAATSTFHWPWTSTDIYYVRYGLKRSFGFPYCPINQRSSFTDNEWKALLKGDLDLGKPIFYSGTGSGSGGHAWVVDGYNTNDQFHCNWGWGGDYNGYYYLNDLTPGYYNINYNNAVISNLEPIMPNCEEISGSSQICYSNGEYYSLTVPSGATISWNTSNNLTVYYGGTTGTPYIRVLSPYTQEMGWLEATISKDGGTATLEKKNISIGFQNASVSGPSSILFESTGTYTATSICGYSPYTYQWWLQEVGGAAPSVVGYDYPITLTSVPRESKSASIESGQEGINIPYERTYYNLYVKITDDLDNEAYSPVRLITAYGDVDLVNITQSLKTSNGNEISVNEMDLKVYPNPVSTSIIVEFSNKSIEQVEYCKGWNITVYDAIRNVKENVKNIEKSKYEFNTSNWSDGIYFLKISSGDTQVATKKLVVIH